MTFVLHWLDRLPAPEHEPVGDKALHLGTLHQRAYPLLPGFVIAATAWREFLRAQAITLPDLATLPGHHPRQFQALARQLRQAVLAADLPEDWFAPLLAACKALGSDCLLLRPSLALARGAPPAHLVSAQWCWHEATAIAQGLKQLWATGFHARSLFYWQRLGLSWDEIQFAVLVQPARTAIAAGTLYQTSQYCHIQAVWGLGLSLTRGEAQPDTYVIETRSGQLRERLPGHQSRCYQVRPGVSLGEDCLERIELTETEQRRAVLQPRHFPPLLALAAQLRAESAADYSLEWLLAAAEPEPELYLTQWGPGLPRSLPLTTAVAETTSRLLGIGAAPGWVVAPVCLLAGPGKHVQPVLPRHILVIERITPDWLPLLEQAAGLILEQGGTTSHGAIVARELGIPAVVGLPRATQRLRTGDRVALDGTRGEVRLLEAGEKAMPTAAPRLSTAAASPLTAAAFAQLKTQVWVNLSQPSAIAQAAALPVQGVGLLRAELMMLGLLRSHDLNWWLQHPAALSDRLAQLLHRFAQAFAPRPVFYRSTDWRAPEFPLLPGTQATANPLLGARGTYSYQKCPDLFAAELAALAQVQQAWGNMSLILPFVRSVEEFVWARTRVSQAGLLATPRFQLWLAAEVPSAMFLVPDYVQAGAQGLAIGSNDLAQLLLGADRDDPDLSQGLTDNHPVVWQAIQHLIQAAQAAAIPCSLCGQAPVKWPALVERLVEWGITSISVEPAAVPTLHQVIAQAEARLKPQPGP